MQEGNSKSRAWKLLRVSIIFIGINFLFAFYGTLLHLVFATIFLLIILSCFFIFKTGIPGVKRIITALALSLAALIPLTSYLPYVILASIMTFFAAIAAFGIFDKYGSKQAGLFKVKGRKAILLITLISIAVGIALGFANIGMTIISGTYPDIDITLPRVLAAVRPGVFEEVGFRMFIYAACVYFLKGEKAWTKWETIACWIMMIVPHAFMHTHSLFGGFTLAVVFGLPITAIYMKGGLVPAMITHFFANAMLYSYAGFSVRA